MQSLDFADSPGYVINGLKREELIALNSSPCSSELYFASLGGDGGKPTGAMADAFARDLGSVSRWPDELIAMGNALGGEFGWVLLVYLPARSPARQPVASEHSQAVAGGIPILALDVYTSTP